MNMDRITVSRSHASDTLRPTRSLRPQRDATPGPAHVTALDEEQARALGVLLLDGESTEGSAVS